MVLVSYPIAMVLLTVLATIVGGDISRRGDLLGRAVRRLAGLRRVVVLRRVGVRPDLGRVAADGGSGRRGARRCRTGDRGAAGVDRGHRRGAGVDRGGPGFSREATDEDVTPHKFTAKVAWLTVGSGLAFGLNFVLIDQAPAEAKLWPLVFARISATVLVVVIAAISAQPATAGRAAAAARRDGCAARHRCQRRDAAGAARVAAVAGRRADVAVPGRDGAAGNRGAARAGDPVANGGHGAGPGSRRDDRRRVTVTLIFCCEAPSSSKLVHRPRAGLGQDGGWGVAQEHVASTSCGRNRVSVKGHQLRLGLFAAVVALVCVNAVAPWGDAAARVGATVLQSSVGAAAVICGVVVARRVHGLSRCWRLLVVAGCLSWLVGELLWRSGGGESGSGASAPPAAIAAYFLPPVLGLAAMVVLVRAGGGVVGHSDGPLRHSLLTTVLDGIVSALAFSILVYIAGFGDMSSRVLPRSDNTAVLVAYSVIELLVVVAGVLMAVIYRPDRPYRANYLLLTGGIVLIAASDRMVTYFRSVGVESGELWGGIGFVLGPLLLAFAMLELRPVRSRDEDAMDWAQLILPYSGFLGIAVMFAFHISLGHQLNSILIAATVLMVLLAATRQVVTVRAQRLLTQRLYEVQSRLAHQVHHDPLTGLPNRVLFAQRLEDAMRDGEFVLIYVDIDDFKEVNDRFGHAGGDELLCAMGERLKRCLRKGDTLARIGGDEFAILIGDDSDAPQIVADRIRVALRDPFAVHGSSVQARASMGLVRLGADGHGPTSDDLLRQADISMYAGKRLGKDTAVIYRPTLGLAADFPTALRQAKGDVPPGFSLAYQPVVRLPDATPVAVEALARWIAPNGTQIPPQTFVAAAEAAGLGDDARRDGFGYGLPRGRGNRPGPRPSRQHWSDAPGRYRFRRGGASNVGAVPNRAEPTGRRDHRDRTDRGPRRSGRADRPAECARCQGRPRRFRCGLQLADISARVAGANRQARSQSRCRCRARS